MIIKLKSRLFRIKIGAVAQLGEHLHGMQGVRGSNPLSSTILPPQAAKGGCRSL